ncbi:DUF3991 domain-containing protein, partial [Eubacterium aggregans]|uniref:DUF3991 domain-containing protein n=1 Tax=Eubacterium aggregans TaxID=81409 RepID=UPI003F40CD30
FVEEKAIYESQNTIRKGEDIYTFYNCTFVSYDNTGHPVGASLRGTASKAKRPFKGMVPGSNLHFGFKRGGSSHRLLYFESPIDLLSYMTL